MNPVESGNIIFIKIFANESRGNIIFKIYEAKIQLSANYMPDSTVAIFLRNLNIRRCQTNWTELSETTGRKKMAAMTRLDILHSSPTLKPSLLLGKLPQSLSSFSSFLPTLSRKISTSRRFCSNSDSVPEVSLFAHLNPCVSKFVLCFD